MNPFARIATLVAACLVLFGATVATGAFAQAALPQPKTQGDVTYLNGGAGDEEVQFLKASMKDYTLALMFSRAGGEYVASVAITIKDAKGATVFEAPSVGPYLLLKLPVGKYSVIANYQSEAKTQPVTVERTAKTPVNFVWK